ncbi:UNVERIFIED_CONTAM: Presequence protease 1, chloroplastic/mitochondrial [Sesamum indicum]
MQVAISKKASRDEAAEKENLAKVRASMSQEDLAEHYRDEMVGDINWIKVLQHDLFTNDLLYAEVVFNMRSLK